ncbi:histidine kinase [Pseudoalteromonas sp. MSK9-3]|uniref:GAF domain-containing protein n=1 Tax=Pseudoalteromonas sp. MSK9-3 TaxID=1897633 RepID=UPI000E6CE292|nr:GAF domain-containing protein [Pseudoalteromonas sp. MSK9-3]RJE73840.1 histidine kinase [Pseudoalteromonas sp. MSK9-3]
MISKYLTRANVDINVSQIEGALSELDSFIAETANKQEAVWSFMIPELGEGGACSLFGHLQETPFELESYLVRSPQSDLRLSQLQTIVHYIQQRTNVDWFGIYQNTVTNDGLQLLKLSYCGAPSRPLFPVNDTFAATSNNVQVVMSGLGRVINNVQSYVESGGEYYTCDPKVQSESCLPLYDEHMQCIGIIDAEAFRNDFFTAETLAILIAACIRIPHYLP